MGDILEQTDVRNRKQEYVARRWAYAKIIPMESILFAVIDGHTEIWDIAEYLDIDEKFLKDALRCIDSTNFDIRT